jgi:Protein of unknown function (DUF1800)
MHFLQRPLAVFLCLTLISPAIPVPAQAAAARSPSPNPSSNRTTTRSAYHPTLLQGDVRILHALDRFTFGLRPGDLESVRVIGLDKWFDQQLDPASLDQADLNTRLAQYPAMQWTPEELLFRMPSNAIIRQAMDGKLRIPERGALHAVYENQIYRATTKKQEQEQKKADELRTPQAASASRPDMASNPTIDAFPATTTDNSQRTAIGLEPGLITRAPPDATSTLPTIDESKIGNFLALQPAQRVAQFAAMQPQEFEGLFKALKPLQRAKLVEGLTPALKEVVLDLENPQRLVNEELIAQRLTRDIYSCAQLQEVMTDFWLNHFNVFLHKNDEMPYYLVSFERDVIRPLALGKFEHLLEATAHSPGMLLYLDNASSIGPDSFAAQRAEFATARRPDNKKKRPEGLNENYARELMELHTLGVNGGYSQADVTQVARILTGWTVDRPQRGGGFKFEPNRHEPGTKIVLGKKFKDHGEEEGHELLHMLAARPATAQFISRKLAVHFVSDEPPQSLVDRLAKSYLSSDGDIAVVLKTLFHSPEFWDGKAYRGKVKTPVEFVVSAARASNASIDNLQPFANAAREMGMPIYGCVTPNGYNWQSSTWVSTNALINRMNFALSLAANRLPGITVQWTPQPDDGTKLMPAPDAEEMRLESLLVLGDVSPSTRSAVLQQFIQQTTPEINRESKNPPVSWARPAFRGAGPTDYEKQDQLLAGLLLGSPEFQRR